MPRFALYTAFVTLVLLFTGCQTLQQGGNDSPPGSDADTSQQREGTSTNGLKPYEQVITSDAKTDTGLFTLHEVGDQLYFEIPDSLQERDMLLISQIAAAPSNLGAYVNAGINANEQVVRWERHRNQILLRTRSFRSVASDTLPVYQSVRANNFEPIIGAFKIEAINEDSATTVIDVTDFFTADIPSIGALNSGMRQQYQVRRLDQERSLIESARSYPINVEVRHALTYEAGNPPGNASTGTISVGMNQSMILLPEEPMQPRLSDPRVGWFTVEQIDYGSEEQKAATRAFIQRWRLEPKDPAAYARGELVEPVNPIVFYLDPATPERWRSYFKQGIEDWQPAFEAAGFKNAIIAKDPPSPEEDPEFSPEDARYSTIRWVASTTRNAMGPRVVDPRSGEIIDSDVIWYHNHIRSYRNRYMIETGAANPSARSLAPDDAEIGETMRAVIAHEVGHALGLPHNMIASSAYPVDSLRSPSFTHRMGVAPTIMDYARLNYVAQPGDGDVRFIRKMGPYDSYAINWGYRIIPGVRSPEQERQTLDAWIRVHENDPMYRFGQQRSGLLVDPRSQTEDIGDDAVKASQYGIANLKRVVPNLIDWTSAPGRDYSDLQELYGELVTAWNRYVGHVLTNVGGVYETIKTSDQAGPVYELVPEAQQRTSVDFLVAQIFTTPTWMLDPAILSRIEHAGAVDRIRALQVTRLRHLLDPQRMQRLIEAEVIAGDEAYTLLELLDDVRTGIWSELAEGSPVDTYRRNLQRGYLEHMEHLMTEDPEIPTSPFLWSTPVDVSQSDIRPFVRGQLETLAGEVQRALRRSSDRATRYHLEDVRVRIERILDPNA